MNRRDAERSIDYGRGTLLEQAVRELVRHRTAQRYDPVDIEIDHEHDHVVIGPLGPCRVITSDHRDEGCFSFRYRAGWFRFTAMPTT